MRYNNYHKHDHISNIYTPDTNTKPEEYIKKCVEYGHTHYFTTNHGSMGDIFEAKTLCDKYGIKCVGSMEGYIVPNPLEKDNSNYHIIIIPKTNEARKKVNLISSRANIEGFYYKPRIFLEDLLALDPNDVFITTACGFSGLLADERAIEELFMPLYSHFGDNLFLEVQSHNVEKQIEVNRIAVALHRETGLKLIAANDSHYVDESGRQERLELLKGKGINYGGEDECILDFPDSDVMFERFKRQGVLTDNEILESIKNTLIFDVCEEIDIDKSIKMPSIYKNLSYRERFELLRSIVNDEFDKIRIKENITGEELKRYRDGIEYEMKIIEDTNEVIHTADYFLFNTKNVDLAVNKYGGVLTRGGRGSCASFYINRVLGMTQLDRFKINLPIFPDRFASTARLLENLSLPDIDYNCASSEPFVAASRELLGEHGCYPMIAYGTMQESEAFRNVCRSKGIEHTEYNDVAKNLEAYKNHPVWKPIVEEAERYVGTIVSASVHPCAHLLLDKNILEEYGVVRLGDFLCVMLTSGEADEYKFLKNDYLIVKVWKLISETFAEIGLPIMEARDLLAAIKDDQRVWDLFKNGLTCTLNQVDSDNGMNQAKRYNLSSFEDGAFIAAAIRPSFDSWREQFLSRQKYSTGSVKLDNVLSMTNHYILFQENLMQYFDWLGVTPAESIGLIKKISKKKIKPEDFSNLEVRLRENWVKNTGSEKMFAETWKMIQSCISYGFCSAHAAATSLDMCYGAYLKVNYPYEYYSVCFNNYAGDEARTGKLREELKYFGISLGSVKFGKSKALYSYDKENRMIYKGVGSIKHLNDSVADELYELSKKKHESFIDLLYDIKDNTSANSRQVKILIQIDYFSDYGDINKLLCMYEWFELLYGRNSIKKDRIYEFKVPEAILRDFCENETMTRVDEIDSEKFFDDFNIPEEIREQCAKYKYIPDPENEGKKIKIKNGYSSPRVFKLFGLSDEIKNKYATKTVFGAYSGLNIQGILKAIMAGLSLPDCSITDRVKYQMENLGYIEFTVPNIGTNRYVVVINLDTKYSPKFLAYNLKDGKTCQMKAYKKPGRGKLNQHTSFDKAPFKDGDILYMEKCEKQPRKANIDGEWRPIPGEFDWWLTNYKKVFI